MVQSTLSFLFSGLTPGFSQPGEIQNMYLRQYDDRSFFCRKHTLSELRADLSLRAYAPEKAGRLYFPGNTHFL